MDKNVLRVGFAKIDITPDYSVGLGGYADDHTRKNEKVIENIYTTCIAFNEGDETILMYTNDLLSCTPAMAKQLRKSISKATGVPDDKIYIAATHCHNAPSYNIEPKFKREWKAACVKAAKQAIADLAPAKIFGAKKDLWGMNCVRHYITAEGTVGGSNFGTIRVGNPAVGYMARADSQIVLLKFEREEGKRPVLMVNWQGHPDTGREIGVLNLAPHFPGPMRDTLSALTGCLVAYFTGADGNMAINSRIKRDEHNLTWREYGVKMAHLAYDVMKEMKEVEGSGIATKREMVTVDVDHSWDHMLEQAKEVCHVWRTVGLKEGDALAKTYDFSSSYQANAIIRRCDMDATDVLEINAIRVGGIGFTTGSYEMFSEAGTFVKQNSPYEFTFLLTGNFKYIPSTRAYDYRCYESDTGMYARGTGEKLAERYVEMLKELQ